MKKVNYEVYAKWKVTKHPRNLKDEVYVSCGVGDDQYEGYFTEEEGAKVIVITLKNNKGYGILFTAPDLNLHKEKDYWLSPSCLGKDEIEAYDFGIRKVK